MGTLKRLLVGDRRDPREELAELFHTAVPEGGSPPQEALSWGREVLERADVNPGEDAVRAISVLRADNSDLGLKSATYLVNHLARWPAPPRDQ